MTIRLTQDMRFAIKERLLEHRFGKQEARNKKAELALAKRICDLRYSPAIRAQMAEVPAGWLVGISQVHVRDANGFRQMPLAHPEPIQASDMGQWIDLTALKGAAAASAASALSKHEQAKKELSAERRAVGNKTAATLAGFSTLAALLKAWPEIMPFTDKLGYDAEKKSLPALIPEGLNESLDLPVKGAA